MPELKTISPPENGLWRVARGPNPLALRDPPRPLLPGTDEAGIANRFDSALGNYRVWYFATDLDGCYGETLAALRPERAVIEAAGDEQGFMGLGDVPKDWRNRRVAVRATFPDAPPFLDVESADTQAFLTEELGWVLDLVGIDRIDVAAIRSQDRRLTRWISQWAWQSPVDQPPTRSFAGIRFLSRLNSDWELWAVFEETPIKEEERKPVLRQDEALCRVAERWGLDLF